MAKAQTSNTKIQFGKRKKGVAKKGYSKYNKRPKRYVGQGR